MDSEKPAIQVALDELRAEATSAEEHAYLDDEQKKIDAERAQALGGNTTRIAKLIELPDGSVATEQELQASRDHGEEPSGPYDGHARQ